MNDLVRLADPVPGFMPAEEGLALHAAALVAPAGPLLEIGSWCGKSAVYLGTAARARNSVLFTVDHHRGSEENQPGEQYHDPRFVDPQTGQVDTLPCLRQTLRLTQLEDCVIVVVGKSDLVASNWQARLGLVFIDGGHSLPAVRADYDGWAPHLVPEGLLAIHDVFPNPADGGRPPFEVYELARASGDFEEVSATGSLRVLRKMR
ncbi:MAG TPA: class I SAM-dependent methyltransferase [Candidatus Dormibacteraeota bacterium]